MELVTQVHILDNGVCVSLCANDLVEGMNPSVLLWVNNMTDWVL